VSKQRGQCALINIQRRQALAMRARISLMYCTITDLIMSAAEGKICLLKSFSWPWELTQIKNSICRLPQLIESPDEQSQYRS